MRLHFRLQKCEGGPFPLTHDVRAWHCRMQLQGYESLITAHHFYGELSYLPALLKLGVDAGHHADGSYEGQAVEDLRDAFPVHAKPLDIPVPAADGRLHAHGDCVWPYALRDVKHRRSVGPTQSLVCLCRACSSFCALDGVSNDPLLEGCLLRPCL